MTGHPPSLTLMVLVDALRPDYVARMPFLKSLASRSAVGRLRECFGFVPRAAYFGGLNAAQFGFTNMFCFDPAASPFSVSRWLPSSSEGAAVERAMGLRQLVEERARSRVPHFAKAYVSTGDTPLPWLRYFDLVERRAPWDRQVGFHSLFHILDDRGIPWFQCSWPDSNRLPDASDSGIVQAVLSEVTSQHQFAYVHLQELDGIGHTYGPNSSEMHRALKRSDRLCLELIEGLRTKFSGRVNIVLFGDHGMVNVTRTLDLQDRLKGLGLHYGSDYAYFLDSTMARFWFFHAEAKSCVESALRDIQGGRMLAEKDLRQFGIAGCDPKNAELIFLVDPGVLIFPNFFQGHGEPIKGMHGYDPDSPDNLGFFLCHEPERSADEPRFIGKVDPPELFALCQRLLGIPATNQHRWNESEGALVPSGRYTTHADPKADETVHQQLQRIVEAIRVKIGNFEAIVLTGSFGRGEGGVYQDESGQFRPVNDYDLLVVSARNQARELGALGNSLAGELGIDYVDLGWSDGQWQSLPNTVAHYDLKHGSQVIAGDPNVLERLPDFASADLPIYEAVKLLLNRTAGLLTGLRGEFLQDAKATPDQHRYLSNQIAKALMAMGDGHLIRWQGYDSSYESRRQRLAALAPGAGLKRTEVRRITEAYAFKCQPDYSRYPDPLLEIKAFYPALEADLIHMINLMARGTARNLSEAMDLYLKFMSADASLRAEENRFCEMHPQFQLLRQDLRMPPFSWRHLIYSTLPFVLKAGAAAEDPASALAEAFGRLQLWMKVPIDGTWSPRNWEVMRSFLIKAWFAVCH